MTKSYQHLATKLIHAGEPEPRIYGAVTMPVFQSSTYEYAGRDVRYIRLNNTPNHIALHQKLAALENAEAALVTASGMAAIATTLLALLSTGSHLLVQPGVYGGTYAFITQELPPLGITFDFLSGDSPQQWQNQLRPQTRAIYVETMTNPMLQVANLEAVVEFGRAHGLVTVIDNTFASPVNFRPPEWGFDLSVHSGTKYLNGHSDIVAGVVTGKAELVEQIARKLINFGGTLDPHACFLLHRGLKTLAVRVKYQNESAGRIARFLADHPAVAAVNYPGLQSHPHHRRASALFDGFGGMLSFELKGGVDAAERFLQKVTLPMVAPSLGGPETLMTRPVTTSHSSMSPAERNRLGITDGLIRLSVGLEATEDLIADFEQALESQA